MNRQYIDVSNFNAPFDNADYLSGLGSSQWPAGRSYWSVANFRAPYDHGYFQDNDLMGLREDAQVVLRQVPTWMFVVAGLGLSYLAWKKYKKSGVAA